MDDDLKKYQVDYAKSGRSSCKKCSNKIENNSLRLAVVEKSYTYQGKMVKWFHHHCFFEENHSATTEEMDGFADLKSEDQEMIKLMIKNSKKDEPVIKDSKKDKIKGGVASGGKDEGASASGSDFSTDYSKTGKSVCRGCDDKISKGEVRLGKTDKESKNAKRFGPQELWHHVDCFVKKREELGFGTEMNPEKIAGFSSLKEKDQDLLRQKLRETADNLPSPTEAKKRKREEESEAGGKKKQDPKH